MPWIDGYAKSDGTNVRGHWRSPAGSGTQVLLFGAAALLVMGYHGHGASSTDHTTPAPAHTVHYPIRFSDTPREVSRPRSTVSYPITFTSAGSHR